jgi:signal recognition particle receptor subunit beta
MASINYAIREISVKIVYYGPGLSGKTTNLQVIHRKIPIDYRSDMVSLATETDRTLFFDFLPLDLGKIKGFSTKFQLYTVPGQVYYNATRKLVLRGVDGVVFVADSAADKMQENLESFQNLHDNLAEYGYQQGSVPIVLQYNKRDLPNALPVDTVDKTVNKFGYPWSEAVASQGKGVFESLKIIGKIVIDTLNRKYSRPSYGAAAPQPAQQQPQAPQRPAPQAAAEGPFYAPPRAQQPPVRQQPPAPAQSHFAQPQQDIFRSSPKQPPAAPPRSAEPQAARSSEYYDYGSINLEPMATPAAPPAAPRSPQGFPSNQESQQSSADKTELDLEIEKYQREIEDKQRRLRNLQSAQSPSQPVQQQQPPPPPQQTQPMQYPAPQKGSYDVYEPPESVQEQMPQYPPAETADEQAAAGDDDQPLYFTSVNTGQRKKIKRPVNPKTKAQGGFFGKMFNKDKPQ